MQTRLLGRTGMSVSVLGFGAMELKHMEERDAARLLHRVLDSGINYIDTSPDYGSSEAYIGKAIANRRAEFFLATKCGCNMQKNGRLGDPKHIWDRKTLLRNIESSLELLRTDHIDVWQLHGAQPHELTGGVNEEALKAMLELKQEGTVRYIGISFKNGGPSDPLYPSGYSFKGLQEFMSWGVFDVMQIVYGGLTRQNEIVIQKASDLGIGMVARGVVKKYRDNYDKLFETAGLDSLLDGGESQTDFLIRFALSHPGISTMIIGTKSHDHLQRNVQAAERGALSNDVYSRARNNLESIDIVPERP